MATHATLLPSADFRKELNARGGASAARCFQCATCSSVCELAPADAPFPRLQMLLAQWGLGERLAADPAVWLCHQCNDCSKRCPRDAKPGDVMQTVRALTVTNLASPRFMGSLVGKAATTWPLLIGVPILFWTLLLALVHGSLAPEAMTQVGPDAGFDHFVPHWLIYSVYFPVAGLVTLASFMSGRRFWNMLGNNASRAGSFVSNLIPVLAEITIHKRFGSCETAPLRRWAHFSLLWGFVGAALASAFIIPVLYVPQFQKELPLPLSDPIKILGNVAAVLLLVGGVWLWVNRQATDDGAGTPTAFDTFFLSIVTLVIVTGVLVEAGRFLFDPRLACWLYICHLGAVLSLFITFPYSKFAHMLYRTLAMIHERMSVPEESTG